MTTCNPNTDTSWQNLATPKTSVKLPVGFMQGNDKDFVLALNVHLRLIN